MDRAAGLRALAFVAVSAALHVLFYFVLPAGLFTSPTDANGAVSVMVSTLKQPEAPKVKPAVKPTTPPKPAERPKPAPVIKEQPRSEPAPRKNEPQKPVEPAPAPVMLPQSAVTASNGGDRSASVLPMGKGNDTGGTGFSDSKGTSREIREIKTGEAPPPAPPRKQAVEEVQKPAPPPPAPEKKVDVSGILKDYARKLLAKIDSKKDYPMDCRRSGTEGVVSVQFTVSKSGSVSGVSVAKSSGSRSLDNAATDAVRNAAPFPPLPEELNRNEFTLRLSINFKLNN